MAKSKLVKANEKIAEKVVGSFETIEGAVVGGYSKLESTVVGGYTKIEDAFYRPLFNQRRGNGRRSQKALKGRARNITSGM